jgi:hypothetical protein
MYVARFGQVPTVFPTGPRALGRALPPSGVPTPTDSQSLFDMWRRSGFQQNLPGAVQRELAYRYLDALQRESNLPVLATEEQIFTTLGFTPDTYATDPRRIVIFFTSGPGNPSAAALPVGATGPVSPSARYADFYGFRKAGTVEGGSLLEPVFRLLADQYNGIIGLSTSNDQAPQFLVRTRRWQPPQQPVGAGTPPPRPTPPTPAAPGAAASTPLFAQALAARFPQLR